MFPAIHGHEFPEGEMSRQIERLRLWPRVDLVKESREYMDVPTRCSDAFSGSQQGAHVFRKTHRVNHRKIVHDEPSPRALPMRLSKISFEIFATARFLESTPDPPSLRMATTYGFRSGKATIPAS